MKPLAIERQQAFAGATQTAVVGTVAPHADPALFAVPVLPVTLLGLELLCDRSIFDLRAATRLLRDDAGAVLQLFAIVADEYPEVADRPTRLDGCLAALPRERLLRSLAEARSGHRPPARFAAVASHAAAVARSAETVAGALGLPAEPARIVGLLHEIGHLPAMLGWSGWPADPALCCDRLAGAYALPAALRLALSEVHRGVTTSLWTSVVAAAHELLPRSA